MPPTDGPSLPDPKARKQWQAIIAAKTGPCRACPPPHGNGSGFGIVEFHHIVSRQDGGDDVADNIIPLGHSCHERVTRRVKSACRNLVESLTDAEYAYAIQRGGEGYFERAYGIRYER